jgi:hypothetical protein
VIERSVGIRIRPLESVEERGDVVSSCVCSGLLRHAVGDGHRVRGLHAALIDRHVLAVVGDLVIRGDPVRDVGAESQRLRDEVRRVRVNHAAALLDGGEVRGLDGTGRIRGVVGRTLANAPLQRSSFLAREAEILEEIRLHGRGGGEAQDERAGKNSFVSHVWKSTRETRPA